jgi:hypothetical protein
MYREKGNHIITCVTEHKAVVDTCKKLEKQGLRVTYLPVQKDGRISLDELRASITDKTIPHHHHDGQQRNWRHSADRRNRRDREGEGESSSIPTRCRRSARCRSTSPR